MREAEYMNHSVASPQPLHMEELQPQSNNALHLKWPLVHFSFICPANIVSAGLGGSPRHDKKGNICGCANAASVRLVLWQIAGLK